MKVTIQKINFNASNKDSQPYLDMNGRPQDRVTIQTDQHGKKWLSSFAYQDSPMRTWKAGQVVDIEIKTKGDFINFSLPKEQNQVSNSGLSPRTNAMPASTEEMLTALRRIDGNVQAIYSYLGVDAGKIARANEELAQTKLPPL